VGPVPLTAAHHARVPLAADVAAIARHAPIAEAELVGLAPARAFDGFPDDIPVRNRRTIEDAVGSCLWLRRSESAGPSTAATPPG
jgi:hypothetical protein